MRSELRYWIRMIWKDNSSIKMGTQETELNWKILESIWSIDGIFKDESVQVISIMNPLYPPFLISITLIGRNVINHGLIFPFSFVSCNSLS
jgi:hypothetical protein